MGSCAKLAIVGDVDETHGGSEFLVRDCTSRMPFWLRPHLKPRSCPLWAANRSSLAARYRFARAPSTPALLIRYLRHIVRYRNNRKYIVALDINKNTIVMFTATNETGEVSFRGHGKEEKFGEAMSNVEVD